MSNKSMLKAALYYVRLGMSVIPANPKDKTPLIKWKEYTQRRATVEEIQEWWTVYPEAMLGIVTGKISNIIVVDYDTKDVAPGDMPKTPCVSTPRGFHFYFKHPGFMVGNKVGIKDNVDIRGENGYIVAPPSQTRNKDGKVTGEYVWVKDCGIHQIPMAAYVAPLSTPSQEEIVPPGPLHEPPEQEEVLPLGVIPEGKRNDVLFHRALAMAKGGLSLPEITETIKAVAARCNPPYPEREIPALINSAMARPALKEGEIASQVREFVNMQDSPFRVHSLSEFLGLSTRSTGVNGVNRSLYKSIHEELRRLEHKGVVARNGRGEYRRVETEIEFFSPGEKRPEPFHIKLPFGEESLVDIYPKTVIVVAGEPNAGKTAYCLNVAALNMDRQDVYYFTSEMGRDELTVRIGQFKLPLDMWDRVKFAERTGNFGDVIRPDSINVIDYLEVSTDFFRVGGMLGEIFERLEGGVAIVALQKNPGTDFGVGGVRSLEKPRLYLAMEPGKTRIVKAKLFKGHNPTGMTCMWDLARGCVFENKTKWLRPGESVEI